MAVLTIVPIYFGTWTELLEPLAQRIQAEFGYQVETRPPALDPERAYDGSRGQYNSRILLAQLLYQHQRSDGDRGVQTHGSDDLAEESASRILGLVGVDLFVPVLTYVFGEAQLRGSSAVVSIHRLSPEVYGLPADEDLLLARLEKEAIHELGHTLGLLHCRAMSCVMRSSTYVEEIDLKPDTFCPACQALLQGSSVEDQGPTSS